MEREYFDARFDGLKELLTAQQQNTNSHISAVSANVQKVREDLQDHKESCEAHGRKAADGALSSIVAWGGLVVATALGIFEITKK